MTSIHCNRDLSYKSCLHGDPCQLDSSLLSNLSNSIYEGIGIKKNPVKHSRCISGNSPNEICKRVGDGIWRLHKIHTIWKNITPRKGIDMKKKESSLRLTSGNSKQTNKAYADLYEQVQLIRKSIILIHEQLASIESKLEKQVSKVNAGILLK